MKTYLYRASNLKSMYYHFSGLCFIVEVNFWRPPKTVDSCDLFILIIIIFFFRRVFSECTEAIATSLISIVTNFPEICDLMALALLCGLNEVLVGSLTDGVLADAILIPPRPPIKRR